MKRGTSSNADWDAPTYDRLPLPHESWGSRLLDRVVLSGDEHALDAGCGTGRDTLQLLRRLPSGHVTAVDASAAMLTRLRERTLDDADRLTVVHADLTTPLSVRHPVDVVFSVATLHWIREHAAVFSNFASVMRPGALLAFECGGRGNIDRVRDAVRRVTGDEEDAETWHFADPPETTELLLAAGFVDVEARLRDDLLVLPPGQVFRDYLATVILGRHLARVPAARRSAFVHAVATEMGENVIDYVRLEVTARCGP